MKQKIIIILGMHRSGTSCLAGILQSHGLFLGDVKTSSPFNQKGNRERPDIFNLQESILNHCDSSWKNPPQIKILPSPQINTKLIQLINGFSKNPVWGFKDPRTIFTLHLWLPLLKNHDVHILASFRHPISVAKSLEYRNKFPFAQGLQLWYQYNQQLLKISQDNSVTFVNFDWSKEIYQKNIFHFTS